MRAARFYLDALPGHEFEGFAAVNEIKGDGSEMRWNGFACPLFAREQADKIILALTAAKPFLGSGAYDPCVDQYVFVLADTDDAEEAVERYSGLDYTVDGKEHWLYAIGLSNWTWQEAPPPAERPQQPQPLRISEQPGHASVPAQALAPAPAASEPAQDLPDIVAAALLLDHHALTYCVEYKPDEARAFLAEADTRNDMPDQEGMVGLLEAIDALIPQTDSGYVHHRYRIGNEGSRVIYVEIIKTYLSANLRKQGVRKDGPFDYFALEDRLNDLARLAHCDEHSQKRNDGAVYEYRLWWE